MSVNNCQATKEYFNNIAEKWDSICHHDPYKISAILTMAGIKKGSRILDIATGTGILIPHLLKLEPAEIVAIDLSEQMIVQAQKNYKSQVVRFENANFYEFEQKNFDFAIIYSAYPHFENKEALMLQLSACLKPGGRFMIAHSESKETINGRHSGKEVKMVSTTLNDMMTESEQFRSCFAIDMLVDTDDLYIISGRKL